MSSSRCTTLQWRNTSSIQNTVLATGIYTEYFGGIRQLVHRIQYCSGIIQLVYRPQHQSDEAGEVMWRKRMKGLYVEAGAWYRPI